MKRMICLLMMFALVIPGCAFAGAEYGLQAAALIGGELEPCGTTCDHLWREMGTVVKQGWYPVEDSDTMHEYRIYHESVCDRCEDVVVTFDGSQMEGHTMEMRDLGHVAGRNLHKYASVCTKCGVSDPVQIGCSGTGNGDCPLPYSLRQ